MKGVRCLARGEEARVWGKGAAAIAVQEDDRRKGGKKRKELSWRGKKKAESARFPRS